MGIDMENQEKEKEVIVSQYSAYKVDKSLWDCIKDTAKIIFTHLLYWALIVFYTLRSSVLLKRDKIKILAAIAYFVLQSDFIHDAIPVVGVIDDAAILWAVLRLLVVIDDSIKAQAAERVRQWFE